MTLPHWAAAIIKNDDKILMILRSKNVKSFPGYWWIPWWKWEIWETPEVTIKREVYEELWVDFSTEELFDSHIFHDGKWLRQAYLFLWNIKWDIKLQEEEIEKYEWMTYDEAIIKNLAFDYKEILQKIHKDWYV